MRVVITGATGMIGGALATRLRAAGHDVIVVSRSPGPGRVVWDLESRSLDGGALDSVDAVVHLAGESIQGRWTAAKKRRLIESRVVSTELLAEAIAAMSSPPDVFISASGVHAYGDRGDERLDESSEPRSDTFMSDLVTRWEAAAGAARDATRVVHPRIGLVLAADQGALPKLVLLTKLMLGGPLGPGTQYLSWISLHDMVEALVHLIDTDVVGPVNVVSPNPVPQREFAKTLGRALGRPAFVPTPAFALKLVLGQFGEELLLHGQRVLPASLEASGFEFDHPELAGVLAGLFGKGARGG